MSPPPPPRTPRKLTDMSELKALTHPIRLRLLYALRANKSMTATQLGDLVDESPASVSYHLRKLAEHGFVKEVENGSDKRQRWWSEANEEGFSWSENDFSDSPESLSVAKASKDSWLAHQWSRLRDFDRTSESWGPEWVSAAFSTDNVLRLTASETAEMDVELRAVVDRWRRHGETATSEEREHVMVLMHGFPTTP
ncbi:helix-turn-helix domain-containing protein [Rhodococcus sp. ARC_M12]|uniref:helix-turn-helix domain-containing protein n=1 Tax=Rhodococcus sp. ARC_M12 TaxID=2928854 RepID=UPI001FB1EDA8|nr:helix-turn-helix domain-containing protein [Rhodococcus sp. ARC_M12]MCJ0978849.1 helix-turn-helix domain-containing protein [Rhodococcus sp. ARC_M12]